MSNFEDALRKGLEAHRDATRAKKEIADMFARLSSAVEKLTDQRVFVEAARVEKTTLVYPLVSMMQRATEFVANQLPELEVADALFAVRHGAEHGKRAQLCQLKIGAHGYPIEITIPGSFLYAPDGAALEGALTQLLEHPDVAGKIARVAQLRGTEPASTNGLIDEVMQAAGPTAAQQTAHEVMAWLSADSEAERLKGYRILNDALQRQEELDPAIRAHLHRVTLDQDRSYSERTESLKLLRFADRLDPQARALLAVRWFDEPSLTATFSSVLSGVFDRRAYLPPLLQVLREVQVPAGSEAPATNDTASHGYRVSNAFGSIRSALEFDRDQVLNAELQAAVQAVCERYKDVPQLAPLLREIEGFLASRSR